MLWHHLQREGVSPLQMWDALRGAAVKTLLALEKRLVISLSNEYEDH